MWTVSNCRGPQTIFQERNLFSLSAAEEICGSPLPELETFSKLLCRPCDRRLWNYKWMSPEPKAKQFARISEPQAPFWSMNFLPTPDIISLSCRQNLVEDLPPLRNFLTHISTWPAATRVLSRMKRERALGTRLLNCFLFFIFQEWLNKVNNALFAKKSP